MDTNNRCYFTIIVQRPGDSAVLLQQTRHGWTLPRWDTGEIGYWQTVDHVNRAARTLIGTDVMTLRCLALVWDEGAPMMRCYLLAPLDAVWEPSDDLAFIELDALDDIALADPADEALLGRHLAERAEDASRPPWMHVGWWAEAIGWIEMQRAELDRLSLGPIEQIRTWERSCVLRIPLAGGALFFKAQPAMFAHELALLDLLAQTHAASLPTLVARDDRRIWTLTADLGDANLENTPESSVWGAALAAYAAMQRIAALHVADLSDAGVPRADLDTLRDSIAPFFAELAGYPTVDAPMVLALTVQIPALQSACDALAAAGLPLTIDHGDLTPANIALCDATPVITDWSDSSLSHPFFSPALLLRKSGPLLFPDAPAELAQIRDAYLAGWADDDRVDRADVMDGLRDAFALAAELAPLHLALQYHRRIVPQMTARWEMHNMVGYFLGMLLPPHDGAAGG